MTIAKTIAFKEYAGNGATTAFSFPYRFFADADLEVSLISSAGVKTVKTLTTHYTLSNTGTESGGTVTMLIAPATGETLRIQRIVEATQSTDYTANDAFPAETHETALDRLTVIAQDAARDIERSIKLTPGTDGELTNARYSKILGFTAEGAVTYHSLTPVSTADGETLYADAASLLASTETSRGTGAAWRAGAWVYEEAASGASDQDVTTAGGVKLYAVRSDLGVNPLAVGATGDGVADDTAKLNVLTGDVVVTGGTKCLTSWTEIPAGVNLLGTGAVILTTPLRAVSGWRIENRKLVKPTGFGFDPEIMPIYRNGRWQGHKRARDVIGTFIGTTYYVDGVSGSDAAAGTDVAPLKSIDVALQKADVAQVLVAPGWYDRDTGWSGAAVSTTADGVVVRPWPNRTGNVYSATSWTPARSDWTRSTGNEHCFESAAGLADNVVNVIDMAMMEPHLVDGQIVSLPKAYTQVATDTLCFATPHSFYVTAGRLVINPNAASAPEGMPGAYNQATIDALFSPTESIKFLVDGTNGLWNDDLHLYCEGIVFVGGDTAFKIQHTSAGRTKPVAFSACQFLLGSDATIGQGFYVDGGQMEIILEDCLAALNERDGFNYHEHGSGGAPDITEINCVGILNGTDLLGTNNGSTAHELVDILRIGGVYGLGEGPSVADVGTGTTWCVGSRVLSSRRVGTGITTSSLYNSERTYFYAYDCSVEGSGNNSVAVTTSGVFSMHNVGLNGPSATSSGAFAAYVQT